MKKMKQNCRGVTIVEAMVAMAVILIVSAAAVILITTFSKSSAKLLWRNDAISLGENSLECFKVANSYTDYLHLLSTLTDLELSISNYRTEVEQVPIDPLDPSKGSTEQVVSQSAVLSFTAENYSMRIYITFAKEQASFSAYILDLNAISIFSVVNYRKAVVS